MSGALALARVLAAQLHGDLPSCDPGSVPADDRCAYVRTHAEQCLQGGYMARYLEVHECFFSPEM